MSVYELLGPVVDILDRLNISYFVTGSVVSFEYGRPRTTHVIDIVIQLHEQDVQAFVAAFPSDRYYIDAMAVEQAVKDRSMFNVIDSTTAMKVDFVLPRDSYDRRRFQRAQPRTTAEEVTANFASPEDVILMKLRYYQEGGSDKHLSDIAMMIRVSRPTLDWQYLDEWAYVLDVVDLWRQVRNTAERG